MTLRIGCAAAPGQARDNKTGSWRVFRPVFDHEKCTSCGMCQLVCPEGCILTGDKQYNPDYDFCKGCGMCAHECPAKAITMETEEK
ncbi:MAG TPA: 4Fe-4S binding protein [Methanospirillum sp.]|uniref:4Fe-4S binding protein n=1 Tax=Methanospirillum sp. TaxID=45200 RepID=UPI002BD4401E|nr:4Fe-4S binding protein [Methanospirillum sp.]HOJ96521.1 4Fe-4S binding protein [Methanospirillum sp.]HOL41098.1 4Fe-4S binding protein [Methanospirillum sp.]HPP78324.1 4Fe-4S binding protein [Methanospirillum sp.]